MSLRRVRWPDILGPCGDPAGVWLLAWESTGHADAPLWLVSLTLLVNLRLGGLIAMPLGRGMAARQAEKAVAA